MSIEGVAAGLAWGTLIYILALTPSRKRSTFFHSILLLGLVLLLVHYMIDLVASETPGISAQSFYLLITDDYSTSHFTSGFMTAWATSTITECLSFLCACICLWLQAKGLLSGIRLNYATFYRIFLTYLVLASLAALGGRLTYMVSELKWLGKRRPDWAEDIVYATSLTYGATYAICIGSYSLVSMCTIVTIVWKRPKSVVSGQNAYASALNLVGLLCAQSSVVPCESFPLFSILLISS
jgi:hypothetical protein